MSLPPLPKNFSQAIDLGALAKPANMPENLPGIALNQNSIIGQVIPESNTKVWIVVGWSARSTNTATLLETMAAFHQVDQGESLDAPWNLGTLNVDAEPQLAKALQINTAPTTIAIIQEQVVPLFESLPPVDQIRTVIDRVLALAAERGVGDGPVEGAIPEEVLEPEEIEALDAMERGDFLAARDAYKKWINRKPAEQMAKIGLAQAELLLRIQGLDPIATIMVANEDPTNIAHAARAADIEISQGLNQSAFVRLIESIKATNGDEQKAIRDHLLQLFELVDPSDPDLIKARGMLASALF
jgi:putative thioredoxin